MNFGRNQNIIAGAKKLARELRKRQTPGESILWNSVRGKKFRGLKLYRQHPLFFRYNDKESFFIADFYCHELKMVIEIDGKSHDYQKEYDELRTHVINTLGIQVLRFTNKVIETNLESVLNQIGNNLK